MYHNTTHQTGKALEEAHKVAGNQDELILEVFKRNPSRSMSANDILAILGSNILLTSVRRSLDTLKKAGHITDTGQKTGPYGRPVFTYKLVRAGGQVEMF